MLRPTLRPTLFVLLLLLPALGAPASAIGIDIRYTLKLVPDQHTARLTSPTSVGDLLFQPDGNGNYAVDVVLYEKQAGAWHQVQAQASLRVFAVGPFGESSRVLQVFTSSATQPVHLTFPAAAVADTHTFDLFVTFSCPQCPDGQPWPTSHHSVQKNEAIALGQMDLADELDYNHGVPPIGL